MPIVCMRFCEYQKLSFMILVIKNIQKYNEAV
jgi:hypothetical protein